MNDATMLSVNRFSFDNLTLNGGTLQTGGPMSTSGQVFLTGAGANTLNVASNTTELSGIISASGGLTKAGTGQLTLSGASTYAGDTTISTWTLQLGAGGTSGSIESTAVVDNAVLAFNRSDDLSFDAAISGTGSVTPIGVRRSDSYRLEYLQRRHHGQCRQTRAGQYLFSRQPPGRPYGQWRHAGSR